MIGNCNGWRKSVHSNSSSSDCVEVATLANGWRKLVRSNSTTTDCLGVASHGGDTARIGVRDSKNRTGPVLEFGLTEWRLFMDRVRAGEHDLS